jgi:hypothetical protein
LSIEANPLIFNECPEAIIEGYTDTLKGRLQSVLNDIYMLLRLVLKVVLRNVASQVGG